MTPDAQLSNSHHLREDLIRPDPLLDCLLGICGLHGITASRASLTAGLPLGEQALSLTLAERAASRAGLATKVQRLALETLDVHSLPAILLLKNQQAVVLLGWDSKSDALVLLPQTGQGSVHWPRAHLDAAYSGVVLFARPHFRFDARTPTVRSSPSQHWFWKSIFKQRFVYQDVLWAALLINIFALALPLFTMNVYDRVVPNHAIETLWALSVGVFLMLSADFLMRLLRGHFVDEASARIDVEISAILMERVLGMQLAYRCESVGSFAANLRGFEQVRDFIASSTVTAMIDLPFALLFLLVISWISPWLALPVIVAFGLILLGGWVMQHRLHHLSELTHKASALRNATLVESLSAIETIKAQGAEGVIQAKWERANSYLAQMSVQMRGISSGAQYATYFTSQAVTVLIVIVGVYLIGQRDLSMGALIACSMLSSRALAPAAQVIGLLMQYQAARTALNSLNTIMDKPLERPADKNFVRRSKLNGDIEFRNVKFAYPQHPNSALDGLSFKLSAGEKVALIGRVGSGKSTIQKLILGLYQPTEGAVLLDGLDLLQLDPADVRCNVAYVAQDVNLLYGSVRDNIKLSMPYADDDAVLAAAEIAGLDDFVKRHPRGLDLLVGERGESISGGQRQSVGLARAVLQNSPILLLDEPTSAMDYPTEAAINTRIQAFAKDKTVVLVTHRTSLLSMVDRVIVVDNGKIVADGPRDQIMSALASGQVAKAA